MFFGISEFNVSMSDTRFLNVETSTIILVSQLYLTNAAMNQITYNTFFFAERNCTLPTFYDTVAYTCVDNSTQCIMSVPYNSTNVCLPCHYSCLTCNSGANSSGCSGCEAVWFRKALDANNACLCMDGYVDVGVSVCQLCNLTLPGCVNCSSVNTCVSCSAMYDLSNTTFKCVCANNTYFASGYCLPYPGCLIADYFNNIVACDTCDTANHFILLNSSRSCRCNYGYFLVSDNTSCQDRCFDNITAVEPNKCDDGNNKTGDGCDENCTV